MVKTQDQEGFQGGAYFLQSLVQRTDHDRDAEGGDYEGRLRAVIELVRHINNNNNQSTNPDRGTSGTLATSALEETAHHYIPRGTATPIDSSSVESRGGPSGGTSTASVQPKIPEDSHHHYVNDFDYNSEIPGVGPTASRLANLDPGDDSLL